jgi:glycine cleavage system aminomethyltransferase T/glycine/D-amino acid oxidase-like deaminating enzyme
MMVSQAQVVIIGAGIVGCSVAYHLARLGWRDVVVLEQGRLFETGGSTGHAPGGVFQTQVSRTMCAFARETVRLYSGLTVAGQPCFYPVGGMEVAATRERWVDLHRKQGYARAWGLEPALLSPREARELLPLLDPAVIQGAYFVPDDGIARAVRACEALAAVARGHGVRFYGETPVTGIEVADGRVRAVDTPGGRIAAEVVVLCAGIWGPKVARLAGVPLPLMPVQHQYVRTTPLAELAGETREVVHPVLRHQDRAMYFRQHADSYGVGSYQHEPLLVEPDDLRGPGDAALPPAMRPFTPQHFGQPWADATALLPALRNAQPIDGINGMFSFTPDGLPLLGEVAQVRGFWVAEAIWITHAGGAGKALAEWIVAGAPELDVRECAVSRFEPFALSPAYVRARGAQQYREVYDIIHPLQPLAQPRGVRTSPFYARQQALGAVFFEARGWERPQWFAANEPLLAERSLPGRTGWAARHWSPIAGVEHVVTRERVALYDMTPLTRLEVDGPGALAWLQWLATNQLDRPPGSVVYTLLCDERGGIVSDITVTRLATDRFQIGCNGPNDLAWLRRHLPEDGSVRLRETTGATCCLGVWGPRARDLVQTLSDADWSNAAFPYLTARADWLGEVPVLAQRISYVGELGWELYASAEYGARLWDLLWAAGQPLGVIAGGRAAFESLRLEKGYRLWGADMHTEYTPDEAGLGFTVRLAKGAFIGQPALARRRQEGVARRLCCLILAEPSVVVMGKEPILSDGRVLGYVTSATYGYSVGQSFAYGYLPVAYAAPGTAVEIEYFGQRHAATVTPEPLFDPRGARLRC